jgi:hypothetical protein
MPMSHRLPSRPTLLTTAVLAGTAQEPRPASPNTTAKSPARNATTPVFYILLSFIIASLILGVFPQY